MSSTQNSDNTHLRDEIKRYKTALFKMEDQWRRAVNALDDGGRDKKLQQYLGHISNLEQKVLKSEADKKLLMLKLHRSIAG